MGDLQVSTPHDFVNEMGEIKIARMRPVMGIHKNGLLRANEWQEIDQAVLGVVRTGLTGIQDLINARLTRPLGGLGTILSGYEQVSDMTEADVSLEGTNAGEKGSITHATVFVPIPIIHKDFDISLRQLMASRKSGTPLDLTLAETATRVVREKMESILFVGHSKQIGGFHLHGYTTHPSRITGTAVGDFGTAGNGYKTMVKALGALAAAGFNGRFMVYIAQTQYNELLNLLGTNDRNELEIIKAGLPQIIDVKPSFDITAGQLVLVQMDSNTVDLAVAEDVSAVQWDSLGGMQVNFRVMAALAPRIKADINGKCGVLHYTEA